MCPPKDVCRDYICIVAKTWRQPTTETSINRRRDKLVCSHTGIVCSNEKDPLPCTAMWMSHTDVTLSKKARYLYEVQKQAQIYLWERNQKSWGDIN